MKVKIFVLNKTVNINDNAFVADENADAKKFGGGKIDLSKISLELKKEIRKITSDKIITCCKIN